MSTFKVSEVRRVYEEWQFKSMVVTLITFLLLNAFLPQTNKMLIWRHLRKSYLVSQTMFFFLISNSLADAEQRKVADRYLYFGMTFLFLYFFHTHEYVGESD